MMNNIEALKQLIEQFHKLSPSDQAYLAGYATHMAENSKETEDDKSDNT